MNYSGTSGGMEADAAEQLWTWSEEQHRFRYTTLLSDDDVTTHKHLCSLKVYGNTVMKKGEFISHIAKRLGMALRNLSTQQKEGSSSWGRGFRKLTQASFTKLTSYYRKAIHAHPDDLPAMTNAVFATYYHAVSTDDNPQHTHHPSGETAGASSSVPRPLGRRLALIVVMSAPLSPEVAIHVKDVYNCLRLSDHLSRCLRGATQNPNESLHSKI